jgi:hypothetical protein
VRDSLPVKLIAGCAETGPLPLECRIARTRIWQPPPARLTHANARAAGPRQDRTDSLRSRLPHADRYGGGLGTKPDAGAVVLEPADVAGAVAADFSRLIRAWIRQIGLEGWRHGMAHLVVSLSARVERDPARRAGRPDDDVSTNKSGPRRISRRICDNATARRPLLRSTGRVIKGCQ